PRPERSSGNSANARQNSSYKPVFLETGLFKRDKTVQFSSVPFIAKKGMINWPCRAPGGLEMRLWPENKGGLFQAKNDPFFRENIPDLPLSDSYEGKRGIRRAGCGGFGACSSLFGHIGPPRYAYLHYIPAATPVRHSYPAGNRKGSPCDLFRCHL